MYSSTLIPGLPIPRPFWYPEGPGFSPRRQSNAQDRGFFSHYADLFQPLRSPPLWHAAPWVASGQGRRWRRPSWQGRRSRDRRQSSPLARSAGLSSSSSMSCIKNMYVSTRETLLLSLSYNQLTFPICFSTESADTLSAVEIQPRKSWWFPPDCMNN